MIGIIVCTSECNLSCRYCYQHNCRVRNRHKRTEINLKFSQAQEMIMDYAASLSAIAKHQGRAVQMILHGGEPLLLYEQTMIPFLEKLKALGCDYIQIQTNGTLLTQTLAEALKQYGVSVVFSIDGPEQIHDAFRVNGAGRGSFHRVMESVRMLQELGVPVSALATVTAGACQKAREIYDFFSDHHLDFSVNRCFAPEETPSPDAVAPTEEQYREFLSDLFDAYCSRGETHARIPCFDRCLHDLKKTEVGYRYEPRISAYISAFHVESGTYKFVAPEKVHTFDNTDDYLDCVVDTIAGKHSVESRMYTGTQKECVIEHLCWQQWNDYCAALEVNG